MLIVPEWSLLAWRLTLIAIVWATTLSQLVYQLSRNTLRSLRWFRP